MNRMEDAKKKYEDIPVPEALGQRVQAAVARSKKQQRKKRITRLFYRAAGRSLTAAAAVVAVFTLMVNTNTVFADTVSEIPVVGAAARLLTFRSFTEENEDMKIAVEVPEIETIEQDTGGLADSINQEIYRLCLEYAEGAKKRAVEYREAFLSTGGTKEEWAAHNIEIRVWYELKSQTADRISFVVQGTENWSSAYNEGKYYNLDLKNGKRLSLKDILGEDYKKIADNAVRSQIPEKERETGVKFWKAEEGGFEGITDETPFYINEAGEPVVVFAPYEIAPGAAGEVEFVIKG